MKIELKDDYDISVDNILDISKDYEKDGFKIISAHFLKGRQVIEKLILLKEINIVSKQIFAMKDGRFVLEISDIDEDSISYFYSYDINDLYK